MRFAGVLPHTTHVRSSSSLSDDCISKSCQPWSRIKLMTQGRCMMGRNASTASDVPSAVVTSSMPGPGAAASKVEAGWGVIACAPESWSGGLHRQWSRAACHNIVHLTACCRGLFVVAEQCSHGLRIIPICVTQSSSTRFLCCIQAAW